jgi:hypothetical protein
MPSVPIPREERDADNEDATRETEDAKLSWRYSDPVGDHIKAEQEKADSTNDIMNVYNHSFIINNEDAIIAEMPDVMGATSEMDTASVELNEAQAVLDKSNQALILAKEGRDFAEGRTNLTEAEAIYMSALDEVKSKQTVVDALTTKVNTAKAKRDDAMGTGHAQVWWAQNQIKRMGDEVPQMGPLEPMVPMSSQLPSGPYTDPFSSSAAELNTRVGNRQQPQYLTQALGPNHPYITGTVEVGANHEEESVVEPAETDVLAPTEREPTVVEG